MENLKDYIKGVIESLPPESLVSHVEFRGQVTLLVRQVSLLEVLKILKDDFGYKYLIDVTAVDRYEDDPRFEVVYHLWCHERNCLLRVKTWASQGEPPTIPSVVGLWNTANWHERECFDMFGIVFEGHPDLRRILLWEGFDGHPLRKDYPVEGR